MASQLIKIYIGRDVDCNYRISSIEISRKHALLEYCESQHYWTISDLNSTNGLYVNSVQLQPFSPYRLVIGDKVSFGPPNQSNYCYQFNDSSPVCQSYALGIASIPLVPLDSRDRSPSQSSLVSIASNGMPTRSGLEYTVTNRGQRTTATTSTVMAAKKVMSRKASADSTERQAFVEHDYSLNSSAADKNRKSKRLKLKDNSDSKAKAIRMENERKFIAEEKKKLEKSKKSLERKKNIDQMKIKRKEEALRKKQKELERKEREAKKREEEIENLRAELLKERKQLADKKTEQTKTQTMSSKRKTRSSSVRESDTKRQCKDFSVMEDLLESELTCSICSEYFILAVNLNCSHTFCEHCIEEWKRTNTDEAVKCPICRETIENQNRALVLDNLIDQFVAQTKPSLVEHRKKVTEERKKKMAKKTSHNRSSGSTARDRFSRLSGLIPSLQFFLRTNSGNSSSDSDTDDLSIININMDNFDSSSSVSSWSSSDSSDDDSDDSSDDSSSSSSDDSVASSQNSIASVRSVRSDHNYIDIDISSLYSSPSANGSNDSNFSDSDDNDNNSDVESLVSIRSERSPRVEIDINSDDSDDSDFSIDD